MPMKIISSAANIRRAWADQFFASFRMVDAKDSAAPGAGQKLTESSAGYVDGNHGSGNVRNTGGDGVIPGVCNGKSAGDHNENGNQNGNPRHVQTLIGQHDQQKQTEENAEQRERDGHFDLNLLHFQDIIGTYFTVPESKKTMCGKTNIGFQIRPAYKMQSISADSGSLSFQLLHEWYVHMPFLHWTLRRSHDTIVSDSDCVELRDVPEQSLCILLYNP